MRKARLEKQQGTTTAPNGEETPAGDQPRVSQYDSIVKENALFQKYYKVIDRQGFPRVSTILQDV